MSKKGKATKGCFGNGRSSGVKRRSKAMAQEVLEEWFAVMGLGSAPSGEERSVQLLRETLAEVGHRADYDEDRRCWVLSTLQGEPVTEYGTMLDPVSARTAFE